jgi:beta-xylosidase
MDRYFDDENEKELKIQLENVKNGRYIVKKHSVNIEHGSVQDELRRIAPYEKIIMPAFLHNDDVEYLKQILVPQQTLRTYEVKDEVLELQITLSANEICYLNIQYAYE